MGQTLQSLQYESIEDFLNNGYTFVHSFGQYETHSGNIYYNVILNEPQEQPQPTAAQDTLTMELSRQLTTAVDECDRLRTQRDEGAIHLMNALKDREKVEKERDELREHLAEIEKLTEQYSEQFQLCGIGESTADGREVRFALQKRFGAITGRIDAALDEYEPGGD